MRFNFVWITNMKSPPCDFRPIYIYLFQWDKWIRYRRECCVYVSVSLFFMLAHFLKSVGLSVVVVFLCTRLWFDRDCYFYNWCCWAAWARLIFTMAMRVYLQYSLLRHLNAKMFNMMFFDKQSCMRSLEKLLESEWYERLASTHSRVTRTTHSAVTAQSNTISIYCLLDHAKFGETVTTIIAVSDHRKSNRIISFQFNQKEAHAMTWYATHCVVRMTFW